MKKLCMCVIFTIMSKVRPKHSYDTHRAQFFSLCMGMILVSQPDETVEQLQTGDTAVVDEAEGTPSAHGCNTLMRNTPSFQR